MAGENGSGSKKRPPAEAGSLARDWGAGRVTATGIQRTGILMDSGTSRWFIRQDAFWGRMGGGVSGVIF
jgi:hypothetical protein